MILPAQGHGKENESWGVAQMSQEEWQAAVERANERVRRDLVLQMEKPLTFQPRSASVTKKTESTTPQRQ